MNRPRAGGFTVVLPLKAGTAFVSINIDAGFTFGAFSGSTV
jgi:hypothetical protein